MSEGGPTIRPASANARKSFVRPSSASAASSSSRGAVSIPPLRKPSDKNSSPPPFKPRPDKDKPFDRWPSNNASSVGLDKITGSSPALLVELESFLQSGLLACVGDESPQGIEKKYRLHRECLDRFTSRLRVFGPMLARVSDEMDKYVQLVKQQRDKALEEKEDAVAKLSHSMILRASQQRNGSGGGGAEVRKRAVSVAQSPMIDFRALAASRRSGSPSVGGGSSSPGRSSTTPDFPTGNESPSPTPPRPRSVAFRDGDSMPQLGSSQTSVLPQSSQDEIYLALDAKLANYKKQNAELQAALLRSAEEYESKINRLQMSLNGGTKISLGNSKDLETDWEVAQLNKKVEQMNVENSRLKSENEELFKQNRELQAKAVDKYHVRLRLEEAQYSLQSYAQLKKVAKLPEDVEPLQREIEELREQLFDLQDKHNTLLKKALVASEENVRVYEENKSYHRAMEVFAQNVLETTKQRTQEMEQARVAQFALQRSSTPSRLKGKSSEGNLMRSASKASLMAPDKPEPSTSPSRSPSRLSVLQPQTTDAADGMPDSECLAATPEPTPYYTTGPGPGHLTPRPDWETFVDENRKVIPSVQARGRRTFLLVEDLFARLVQMSKEKDELTSEIERLQNKLDGINSGQKQTLARGFVCLGTSQSVPPFLRHLGRVNLRPFTRTQLEDAINAFWREKAAHEDQMGTKMAAGQYLSVFSVAKAAAGSRPGTNRGGGLLKAAEEETELRSVQLGLGLSAQTAQYAYSLWDACISYRHNSFAFLFLKIITGELPMEFHFDLIEHVRTTKEMLRRLDAAWIEVRTYLPPAEPGPPTEPAVNWAWVLTGQVPEPTDQASASSASTPGPVAANPSSTPQQEQPRSRSRSSSRVSSETNKTPEAGSPTPSTGSVSPAPLPKRRSLKEQLLAKVANMIAEKQAVLVPTNPPRDPSELKTSGSLTREELTEGFKKMFPAKSVYHIEDLAAAIDQDIPDEGPVPYPALFATDREGIRSAFLDCLRNQYVSEALEFYTEIEEHVVLKDINNNGSVSLEAIATTIRELDPHRKDIPILLSLALPSLRSSGELDMEQEVKVSEFLLNLRSIFIKRMSRPN